MFEFLALGAHLMLIILGFMVGFVAIAESNLHQEVYNIRGSCHHNHCTSFVNRTLNFVQANDFLIFVCDVYNFIMDNEFIC